MSFETAITTCLKKYVDFQGRAPRSEYWYFVLFEIMVLIAASILDSFIDPITATHHTGVIGGLAMLALLLPGIAVSVRRLHDMDKSGFWYLIVLIPLLGIIALLIWFCFKGTEGENRFGPDPLQAASTSA